MDSSITMRIFKNYAYICIVKERLNLTIDGKLLEAIKAYAASKEMSVSELVESYFRSVTKPVQKDNILDLMDRLESPGVAQVGGPEEGKYGF
jgi:hypothetical protein